MEGLFKAFSFVTHVGADFHELFFLATLNV